MKLYKLHLSKRSFFLIFGKANYVGKMLTFGEENFQSMMILFEDDTRNVKYQKHKVRRES